MPNDALYQVFTVNNPNSDSVNISTYFRNSNIDIVKPSALQNYMLLTTNCINEDGNITVSPNSVCELIVKEPKDINSLQPIIEDSQNIEKGNLTFKVNYKSGYSFVQKFQSNVVTHNEHRDQTYPNGTTLFSNSISRQETRMIGCCGHGGPVEYTATYNTKLYSDLDDLNTIHGDFNGARIKLSLLNYQTETLFDNDNKLFMEAGSGCYDNNCRIIFKIHNDIIQTATFNKPLLASDCIVADKLLWDDVGLTYIAKNN